MIHRVLCTETIFNIGVRAIQRTKTGGESGQERGALTDAANLERSRPWRSAPAMENFSIQYGNASHAEINNSLNYVCRVCFVETTTHFV